MNIAFYISNHGFGHATRTAALVEQLIKLGIGCFIITDRPLEIFQQINSSNAFYRGQPIDFGMVQNGWIDTDIKQTKEQLIDLWEDREEIIYNEIKYCRKNKIDCIVCDIPFFPFEVASILGIPACGVSNFDWAFIYEKVFIAEDKVAEQLMPGIQLTAFDNDIDLHFINEQIKYYYQKADFAVRLPFSNDQSMSGFNKVINGDLLAAYYNKQERQQFKKTIKKDFRLRKDYEIILISFGGYGEHTINLPELYKTGKYIFAKDFGKYKYKNYPRCKLIPEDYPYHKIMAAADIIVTKTGYSTFAEALKNKKKIIYTGRNGNPEDKLLLQTIKTYPLAYYIDSTDINHTDWEKVIINLDEKGNKLSDKNESPDKVSDSPQYNDSYYYPPLREDYGDSNFNVAKTVLGNLMLSKHDSSEIYTIIDVGSNNVQLLWCKITPNKVEPIHKTIRTSALSKGMKDGELTIDGVNRTKKILKDYIEFSSTFSDHICILGTSCSREATNIYLLKAWLYEEYTIDYRIISDDQEASLLGLANRMEFAEYSDVLFFDIGGGSTEFIAYHDDQEVYKHSIKLGIRSLINECLKTSRNQEEIIEENLSQINFIPQGLPMLVGIGGTVTNISAVKKGLTHYDSQAVHRSMLTICDIDFYSEAFIRMSYEQIKEYMPFEPERAEIILTGLNIVGSLIKYFGFTEFLVSDLGIIFGEAERIRAKIAEKAIALNGCTYTESR